MVYVTILIILVIAAYGWAGFRRGFLNQIFDLAGIVVSFVVALRYFNFAASILENWGLNQNLAKPIGFFALWVILQIILNLITLLIFHFVPKEIETNKVNRFSGIIPGLVKGVVIATIVLTFFFILPISASVKDNLVKNPISGFLLKSSARFETQMEKIFGNVDSLIFTATVSQDEETTKLDFKTDKFTIDETSENAMVVLVNNERVKVGLQPLKIDNSIRAVARLHSIDMAKNGYFSHVGINGKTPADRMTDGGVNFWLAGENIALAPSYELAEIGFMNSPKHRDNILDPKFGRIGIGIIDLGVYGKMVTQNFAD